MSETSENLNAPAENCGSSSQQRMVRCCATCADWLSGKMECRYVEDEPAPPESVCEGWIRRRERLPHWDKWAKDKAPNVESSATGGAKGAK